ncbi:MAG: ribonuclease P protein component [bacterium]|nr:ribonuclease P protein component [Candidatus Wildermuthbacteria bacterium]MDP2664554.1 ribonuclease P protein component [bacterium]
MIPKAHRLTKEKDFKEVLKNRRGFREDGLLLKTKKTPQGTLRFGIVVGKTVEVKATRRNRLRRLLSAALEKRLGSLETGFDAVLIALPGFKALTLLDAQTLIDILLIKASLTKTL